MKSNIVMICLMGEWKSVHRYPYGENELYHLGDDPNEKNNLINHEDIVEIRSSLQADMEQWFYEYRDREKDARIEEVWG